MFIQCFFFPENNWQHQSKRINNMTRINFFKVDRLENLSLISILVHINIFHIKLINFKPLLCVLLSLITLTYGEYNVSLKGGLWQSAFITPFLIAMKQMDATTLSLYPGNRKQQDVYPWYHYKYELVPCRLYMEWMNITILHNII